MRTRNHTTADAKSKGVLIVVEGIDGSGKSTQLHLLDKWLRSKGFLVFTTEWNSSDVVKEITSKGKKKALLTPTTFSLLHATDFADRYERNIAPLLRAGYIVLADRYVYTAFARDVVRGCSSHWVRKVYGFAAKPDIAFYFKVPIDVAIDRILVGRPKLKYYEAGMDLNLANDPFDSYRIFQGRIIDEYENMAEHDDFTVIDATRDIEEQQILVRQKVTSVLPPTLAVQLEEASHVSAPMNSGASIGA
ncbi:MAG TPA: dTMP kinase [Nitrososphaerales archaeon]|nr:dTMP kinase [Nitrososphaerales archaeon]